ncbi:MAG: spore germination protein GerW family protein [Candidatus Electryoneaceae bacterium]|nr:spore germination protein GerW family protein [Candidatus Electryoneaceae bacterium]
MSNDAQGMLETIISRLRNLAHTETIVGDPVEFGEVTILPVIKFSVGFGAGGGEGTDSGDTKKGSGHGGGAGGGGASVSPVGFLVWDGKDVRFISVSGKSKMDSLFEVVPDLMSKFGGGKKKKKKSESEDHKSDDDK